MRAICGETAFIRAWMDSDSIAEVARRTGLQNNSCRRRACLLRKRGNDLPYMLKRAGREVLKTGDRVHLDGRAGRVAMSERATSRCVIAWDDGGTTTATRRGAIYVEKI